jgi:hypothetical protein
LPVGLHVFAVCSRRDTQSAMTILVTLGKFLASKDKYVRSRWWVNSKILPISMS